MKRNINLIVKLTNNCNLSCSYCFQNHRSTTLQIDSVVRLVNMAINEYAIVNCIFHGGEPLMVGKCYFNELMQLLPTDNVTYSLQTNGTLLDDEWLTLLNQYNISVSVSDDGDYNSLRTVIPNRCITRNMNTITVLHRHNISEAINIYEVDKLTDKNICYNLAYASNNSDFSLTHNQYFEYIKFIEYVLSDNTTNAKPERNITNYVKSLIGYPVDMCTMGCGYQWLTLDADNKLYGCDRITSIVDGVSLCQIDTINEFFNSQGYVEHAHMLYNQLLKCDKCEYNTYCINKCALSNSDSTNCELSKRIIECIADFIVNDKINNFNYRRLLNGEL